MLLERLPQLRYLCEEALIVFRGVLKLGQQLASLLVVAERLLDEVLGFLVLLQNGKEVLLF